MPVVTISPISYPIDVTALGSPVFITTTYGIMSISTFTVTAMAAAGNCIPFTSMEDSDRMLAGVDGRGMRSHKFLCG